MMTDRKGGNDGALFINDKKEPGDKRPYFTGNITVNGVKYSLAGWKNISANDVKYISLKISEWRDAGEHRKAAPAPQREEFDDDISF